MLGNVRILTAESEIGRSDVTHCPITNDTRGVLKMKPLLLIAIVAIIAVSLVVIYDLNGHSLDFKDRQVVLVVSDSMDGDEHDFAIGSFPANTLVMIEHVPENEIRFLRVGQVISYYDDSILVHHRITQVNDDSFYVKGDNGHSVDKVMFGDVNGVVVGTNSWMGSILGWLSSNFFLFLAIMFILCCAIILRCTLGSKSDKEAGS
jgi:hypothetical protein